jgi:Brp/Blh family beta-carotene 15,15'-monooxygenase
MKNYFGAIFTAVYMLCYQVFGPWDITVDYIIAGILLFTTGIPHGAGDHLIAQKIASREKLTFHLKPFIVFYIGIMLAYALLWYITPLISFIIFIAISVFHFGDMEDITEIDTKHSVLDLAKSLSLGSGILGFILFSHWDEAFEIISKMQVNLPSKIPNSLLYVSVILLALGFQKKNYPAFLNTFLTLVIGYFIPLIPAFICYFSCCHAVYSFTGMKNHLELTFLELYKKLVPFSLGALFLGISYMILVSKDLQIYPIFIFLSLLTLPHFMLMHKLIKRPF